MGFSKNESLKAKGIGILLLLFHHLFNSVSKFEHFFGEYPLFSLSTLEQIGKSARVCVVIFVFVSAYGLSTLYAQKSEGASTLRFCAKRWFSMMKGLWFLYPIYVALLFLAGKNPAVTYRSNILFALIDWIGLADFFGTPTVSGAWWYMSFAQILILLLPFLYGFCRKFGWYSLFFAVVLLQYLSDGIHSPFGGGYHQYYIAILLGILCEQTALFERIPVKRGFANGARGLLLLAAVIGLLCLRLALLSEQFSYNAWRLPWVLNSVAAMLICILSYLCCRGWTGSLLAFLGKHSGNMFLIHIYFISLCPQLIYWTGSVCGSVATLLLISLLCSQTIEWIKRIVKYDALMGALQKSLSL